LVRQRRGTEISRAAGSVLQLVSFDDFALLEKEGNISATRNDNANRLLLSFARKVLFKPPSQQTRIIADDIVLPVAVSRGTSEDVFSNLLFRDLICLLEQMFFTDIDEEVGEEL
jgi:hypothetical protein